MKRISLAAAVLGGLCLLAFVPVALAKDGDVIRTGTCSMASNWKLELSPENGAIEVDFEVDQNVVGDTWRVRILHNTVLVFKGNFVTKAPSGSFEARIVEPNLAGPDAFKARAVNVRTGEICIGRATANF
jgi:hypothetical protein